MGASQHVEVEAAKFLHKLIQESKDEPAKLATKLYVICQHMKLSGKEQSLPYQVISRAMETVISQNGLDINALKSSRIPLAGGPRIAESGPSESRDKEGSGNQFATSGTDMPDRNLPGSTWQIASTSQTKEEAHGSSFQNYGMLKDSKAAPVLMDMTTRDGLVSNRPTLGLRRGDSIGMDVQQGSVSQRSSKSSELESPASIMMDDSKSGNSQERHDTAKSGKQTSKKDSKKTVAKRKRADPKTVGEVHSDNPQSTDSPNTSLNLKKGKQMKRGATQVQLPGTGDDQSQVSPAQYVSHVDHLSSQPCGARTTFGAEQDGASSFSERSNENTKNPNSFSATPTFPDEVDVSSAHSVSGLQKGGLLPQRSNMQSSTSTWNQNRFMPPLVNSQGSIPSFIDSSPGINSEAKFQGSDSKGSIGEASNNSLPTNIVSNYSLGTGKNNASGAFSSYSIARPSFATPPYFNNSSFEGHDLSSKLQRETDLETPFGSHSLEKSSDANAVHPSIKFPSLASAKGSNDSEVTKSGFSKEIISQVSEKGRTLHVEQNPYFLPQGSWIPAGQTMDNISKKDEAVNLRNQDYLAKLKSEVNLCGEPNNNFEISALRTANPKDVRTGITSEVSTPNMPFKEHQLKQLRAQCLVFLAFRSNMAPRKSHLEYALGAGYPKEDGNRKGLNDSRATDTSSKEPANSLDSSSMFIRPTDIAKIRPGSSSTGSIAEADSSSKDTENANKSGRKFQNPDRSFMVEEQIQLPASNQDSENVGQECADSRSLAHVHQESDSLMLIGNASCDSRHEREGSSGRANQQGAWINRVYSSVVGVTKPLKLEGTNVMKSIICNDQSKESPANSKFLHDSSLRAELYGNRSQSTSRNDSLGNSYKPDCPSSMVKTLADNYHSSLLVNGKSQQMMRQDGEQIRHSSNNSTESLISSGWLEGYAGSNWPNDQTLSGIQKQDSDKQFACEGLRNVSGGNPSHHANMNTLLEKYADQEEENKSVHNVIPTSPQKYTTSEKWIMDHQQRRHVDEQKWALKKKKAEERITVSFANLKQMVSSSEDISARTKSVIELKKLQLLKLQRRLRCEFLDDFFKPIVSDMERLKSMKKHRHGRRIKQLEKFEQKMKEERQKRIRERQKEFFGEIEGHREKLEDCFKVKRERWKGFNRYVKEFHKRKERVHREKIDRIQREKINLLKNNDVEGYLRMVQDAKSDRVNKLLKETEKYLQKLGAKLQQAKAMTRRFEMEMDDARAVNMVEKNEVANDNEDESDQAQHYLESNEKYYMMAHSVKESINDQPTSLQGGKLREYQMNGLRWLVSLYNNHLNGILADEMGLGKTVQVIALICYLMEAKNDRGPFLVVVPSSVLPGWESEINFWAPSINKIAYAGPPEERRRLFKERIVQQKFNVLLTTYEYLMNKHDRPKLSKIHWHYVIIDEGHRIKNASCKLNADLKHYQSSHRLLLTGTPLQNNLEELWALLNFLLPNIFNSSEDFSQWFNKPFQGNGDNSPDEALLSEEENLLIINRLHQVLRPFVLRRLKHKVENELPEKIERLIRCEASAYQKLLMKRVEENLGSLGNSKGRTVHNTVMELRNICNHPYLSQIHAEEVDSMIPKHYLPPVVRLCGKLEMLDRLLPKLKATDHRVLFFSTMTRLLNVMEEYLVWKRYKYLRLDGHTSGSDRGALIDEFNRPGSEAFIFLLSIRAGGVGVNLQAADTVIIFDTDWNPQVDLQAQARAHRIGQKKDVLVLRLETVRTVEEQVRAAAEHKLGVANQSITAGFFDNHTSAEDRREYLESLLRESKKEEAAPVLDDDSLNDLIARSESEIEIFESVDKQRREEELAAWQRLVHGRARDGAEPLQMPSRLVTEEDLKAFYKAMMIYEPSSTVAKRKTSSAGGLDTQQYGRGKRAREVRSYEDQWTEEEFEKLCQVDSPESSQSTEVFKDASASKDLDSLEVKDSELPVPVDNDSPAPYREPSQPCKDPPAKRGRGRPKRAAIEAMQYSNPSGPSDVIKEQELMPKREEFTTPISVAAADSLSRQADGNTQNEVGVGTLSFLPTPAAATPLLAKGKKTQGGEKPRGRARKQNLVTSIANQNLHPGAMKGADAASSKSAEVALPQERLRSIKTSGIANPSPSSYEVSTLSGSQKSEKLVDVPPVLDETDIGKGSSGYEIKAAPVGTEAMVSSDPMSPLNSKTTESSMKTGVVQGGSPVEIGVQSTATSLLSQDVDEKQTHLLGSLDIAPTDMQRPAEKEDVIADVDIKSRGMHKTTEKGISFQSTVPKDDMSSGKQKPGDRQDDNVPFAVQSCEKQKSAGKQDDHSLGIVPMASPSSTASKGSQMGVISGAGAIHSELQSPKPVEFLKQEEVGKVPDVGIVNVEPDSLLIASPLGQVQNSQPTGYSPMVVKRGTESNASVRRKKAAARETRSRSSAATAVLERRARLAGMKQAEGVKVISEGTTIKGNVVKEAQESGGLKAVCDLKNRNPEVHSLSIPSVRTGISTEQADVSSRCDPLSKILVVEEKTTSLSGDDSFDNESEVVKVIKHDTYLSEVGQSQTSPRPSAVGPPDVSDICQANKKAVDVGQTSAVQLHPSEAEVRKDLSDNNKAMVNDKSNLVVEFCNSISPMQRDMRSLQNLKTMDQSENESLSTETAVEKSEELSKDNAGPQLHRRNTSQVHDETHTSEELQKEAKQAALSESGSMDEHLASSLLPPKVEVGMKDLDVAEHPSNVAFAESYEEDGSTPPGFEVVNSVPEIMPLVSMEEKVLPRAEVVEKFPDTCGSSLDNSESLQIIADSRQTIKEDILVENCEEDSSITPGFDVLNNLPEKVPLSTEEKTSPATTEVPPVASQTGSRAFLAESVPADLVQEGSLASGTWPADAYGQRMEGSDKIEGVFTESTSSALNESLPASTGTVDSSMGNVITVSVSADIDKTISTTEFTPVASQADKGSPACRREGVSADSVPVDLIQGRSLVSGTCAVDVSSQRREGSDELGGVSRESASSALSEGGSLPAGINQTFNTSEVPPVTSQTDNGNRTCGRTAVSAESVPADLIQECSLASGTLAVDVSRQRMEASDELVGAFTESASSAFSKGGSLPSGAGAGDSSTENAAAVSLSTVAHQIFATSKVLRVVSQTDNGDPTCGGEAVPVESVPADVVQEASLAAGTSTVDVSSQRREGSDEKGVNESSSIGLSGRGSLPAGPGTGDVSGQTMRASNDSIGSTSVACHFDLEIPASLYVVEEDLDHGDNKSSKKKGNLTVANLSNELLAACPQDAMVCQTTACAVEVQEERVGITGVAIQGSFTNLGSVNTGVVGSSTDFEQSRLPDLDALPSLPVAVQIILPSQDGCDVSTNAETISSCSEAECKYPSSPGTDVKKDDASTENPTTGNILDAEFPDEVPCDIKAPSSSVTALRKDGEAPFGVILDRETPDPVPLVDNKEIDTQINADLAGSKNESIVLIHTSNIEETDKPE